MPLSSPTITMTTAMMLHPPNSHDDSSAIKINYHHNQPTSSQSWFSSPCLDWLKYTSLKKLTNPLPSTWSLEFHFQPPLVPPMTTKTTPAPKTSLPNRMNPPSLPVNHPTNKYGFIPNSPTGPKSNHNYENSKKKSHPTNEYASYTWAKPADLP